MLLEYLATMVRKDPFEDVILMGDLKTEKEWARKERGKEDAKEASKNVKALSSQDLGVFGIPEEDSVASGKQVIKRVAQAGNGEIGRGIHAGLRNNHGRNLAFGSRPVVSHWRILSGKWFDQFMFWGVQE